MFATECLVFATLSSSVMQRLRRFLIGLSRIRHSRGFGIQSPTDYSFVRYVINEHDPYYQYKDLEKVVKGLDSKTRKLCQLYFRLSNFCQSPFFVDVRPDTSAAATYVKAACGKTKVVMVDGSQQMMLEPNRGPLLLRCKSHPEDFSFLEDVFRCAQDGTILIIEDIKSNAESREVWQKLSDEKRVAAAYDLYDCGIIRVDKHRYTKKYIINF